ncbi:MAG: HAMP domain-containing histidine kinase [Myxococcales bacterium]|nr:HAMP domain-containing histidine kinase [Myxococcales bacterium]
MTTSLRRRIYAASGLLIALQVAGTVLGFASWGEVRRACTAEDGIAAQREALLRLGAATREVYVHEAHTLIERGPGHLDHLSAVQSEVDGHLAALHSLNLGAPAEVDAIHASIAAANAWFASEVFPRAAAGAIDQGEAVRLHGEMERRAMDVEAHIGSLTTELEAAQGRERAAIAAATQRAWVAVAVLTFGGLLLGLWVASRLAASILGPVRALGAAAAAFGAGKTVPLAPEGDDELGELGRGFNRMVAQVRAAERRQVETERLAALGEMSGAVAHELMNPLAVILADPAMRGPQVAASRAEAEHARRVVQGLLGFARPGEEPAETVDLAAAAVAVAGRLLPTADLRDIRIRVDAAPGVSTMASPSAVRQVFDNLVRNAVDASPAGGEVEILVRAGPLVEVRDRGAGIPAAVKAKLYQPFVTGRPEGTGLGLAVCHRIAQAHGGDLHHRDRDGGGTVAFWTLGSLHG